jgi:hypothetical protein
MLEVVKLIVNMLADNAQLAVALIALAGFGVAGLAIYALLQALKLGGRRRR